VFFYFLTLGHFVIYSPGGKVLTLIVISMSSFTTYPLDGTKEMNVDILPWIQSQHSISYGDGRGIVPIHPQAIPPWCKSLSTRIIELIIRANIQPALRTFQ
jgi:hypothetical protein